MKKEKFYSLQVAGLQRKLPIVSVAPNLAIASFVILGDSELVIAAAQELAKKLPEADYFITAEAKGIPLIQELCHVMDKKRYFVARKSVKPYMQHPLTSEVVSITTQKKQLLCLDAEESKVICGKKIIIVDDVISTGESLKAMRGLVELAGGNIVASAAILAEGEAANRKDIIFLQRLPIFQIP